MPYILHVEDDYLFAQSLERDIKLAFPSLRWELVRTEAEFINVLPRLVSDPPDVVVMDVMLRWTNPSKDMPPSPPDVATGGPYRAGFRCQKRLAEKLPDVPVFFYTVLERSDLENELKGLAKSVLYLPKSGETSDLIHEIRRLISRIAVKP